MMKDLTNTAVSRQNILNNSLALAEIEKEVGIKGVLFESEYKFVFKQISDFLEVPERTLRDCIAKNEKELTKNGYEVIKGKRLMDFKLVSSKDFGYAIDCTTKTTVLGIFNFRTLLNIAMLLTDSEKARELRGFILDIVIDTINKRTGGGTKYINQRDEDYLANLLRGEDYRKEFTDALRDCVDMGNFKYMVYTDKVYNSIFRENAAEYRKILKLEKEENVRETMYSEVLDIISSYEVGFADELKKETKRLGRMLSSFETDKLFSEFEKQKLWEPLREKARVKMASRDLCFRDALHQNLEEYISAVPKNDFDRLESALEHIQNDDYYPTFEEKLVHLIWSINRNHAFSDGNKRLSITLGGEFLLLNGYLFCIKRFFLEMENISYHLAAGRIDKDLLTEIIHSFLENENDFCEELKLKILLAIDNQEIGFSEN